MITRTERVWAWDFDAAVAQMEAAGWAVRQIVFEPDPEGAHRYVVVYEREAG